MGGGVEFDSFVALYVLYSLFYLWKHRPFEALNPVPPSEHPAASACCICIGIVTNVIATTPITPNAITKAIITMEVLVRASRDDELTILFIINKRLFFLNISASELHSQRFFAWYSK